MLHIPEVDLITHLSFYSSGKKCTYGIKCKFYHPERTNQSQRSLADELRENARLSGSKEESRVTGPLRGMYPRNDPGFGSSSPSLEQELEQKLNLDPKSSDGRDVMLQYWDGILSTKKPLNTATVGQRSASVDRTSLQAPYPTNPSSIFSSDSGLGSYESQFSDPSQSIDELHRTRSNHPPMSSNLGVPAGGQRYYDNMSPFSNYQPNFGAYSSLPLPNPIQPYGLPAYGAWSYPYFLPHATSLPEPLACPSSHRSPNVYGNQQHSAMPKSNAFQEEREEVRKKLHAIFNPHHVNKVMEMFPQLKDAQQLAAEILKLKSRGEFFWFIETLWPLKKTACQVSQKKVYLHSQKECSNIVPLGVLFYP